MLRKNIKEMITQKSRIVVIEGEGVRGKDEGGTQVEGIWGQLC